MNIQMQEQTKKLKGASKYGASPLLLNTKEIMANATRPKNRRSIGGKKPKT